MWWLETAAMSAQLKVNISLCVCVQSTEDWEAIVSITSVMLPSSLRCGNLLPTEQLYRVTLPHRNRYKNLCETVCVCVITVASWAAAQTWICLFTQRTTHYRLCVFLLKPKKDFFRGFVQCVDFTALEKCHHSIVIAENLPWLVSECICQTQTQFNQLFNSTLM